MPRIKKSSRPAKKPSSHTIISQKHNPDSIISQQEIERVNATFSENALKMMRKRYLVTSETTGQQETPGEMMARIAHALASVEKKYGRADTFVRKTEKEFFGVMARKEFTPAGRTITNAGESTPIVANCIVLPIHDSMESIFQTLKDAALLQQAGSGLGFAFDELRPALFTTKRSRGVSSGPVSFLKVYNEAFGIIKQQGRHGANMAMMGVDHPDILDFIRAKEVEGEIRNFNISVKVTDAFMRQVTEKPDTQWYCTWNGEKMKPRKVVRTKAGNVVGVEEIDITAKEIFDELVHYAWTNGEPGIVFVDEVNRTNPLPGLGDIKTSNPCGEQFLHPYDNCNLGSLNLAVFVKTAGKKAVVDWTHLKRTTRIATRMLDNVIDLFDFPVPQVSELAKKNRRVGLGIMGLADLLYQLDIPYNSKEALALGEKIMAVVSEEAHAVSEELAKEKGVFPNVKLSIYAKKKRKPRNAALTTVAPTGSISMMFDTSSGIEPNFALSYVKQDKDGQKYHYFNRYFEEALKKYKFAKAKTERVKAEVVRTGSIQDLTDMPEALRRTFVVAMDISAQDHMKMQAAFQRTVDNSISKTINFPNSATEDEVLEGFVAAWRLKCKSATVYRDGSRVVQVLNLGTGEGIKAPDELSSRASQSNNGKNPTTLVDTTGVPQSLHHNRVKPRSRPEIMRGKTYKLRTGYGNIYVTINDDENGDPFEVFTTIGKSGGFFQEQSEGIGRLVSLALRSGVKIEDVIDNLKGIRGPMPVITDKGTVLSLPDAIGRILEIHVQARDAAHETISATAPEPIPVTAQPKDISHEAHIELAKSIADYGVMPGCPECDAPLVISEGCISCKSCGFSRCM